MSKNLNSGRAILITGCSSGIGLCCAQGLHERGYQVFATARQQEDVDRLSAMGLTSLRLDLNDSTSINHAVDTLLEQTGGRLYGLFNNAGYGQPGAVEDLSRATLRKQFETNFFGTLELTNRAIPVMRQQNEGRILINSSVLGIIAMPMRGAYNATKFALEGIMDTLRLELRQTNIHISLIEPGPILSQFRANSLRAFEENIDVVSSVHREQYESTLKRLKKEGPAVPFTLPPEAVLQRVIHALEKPRPKIRYPVTFPTYLFAFLKRILTHRALDRILSKAAKTGNS